MSMTLYCQIVEEHREQPEATHEADWSEGVYDELYLVCPRHATVARKHGIAVTKLTPARRAEIEAGA